MTAEDFKNGQVLLIDKTLHWTSFQVVSNLRNQICKQFNLKSIKVGHAGTLDPLATGLLIICTGKKTKSIETYQKQTKEYTGSITLGATTPSYDLETEINKNFSTHHINESLLRSTAKKFIGTTMQKPPLFSALKKNGKRLYEIAREGKSIEIASREIKIFEFEITKINLPRVDFRLLCSKGTYIRSLAHDFGAALNSGAYLSSLRRTKIGEFLVKNAIDINQITSVFCKK
ncbi:MAG: tRNA pseudouridine(55) synthase TruB [Tenacibaculum sp.]